MSTEQDVTKFIECAIVRVHNNFHQVLCEIATAFKKRGFFLKPDWGQILITIFTDQMLKEFRSTVLPTAINSADNEQTNVKVGFNDLTENLTENGIIEADVERLDDDIKIDNGGFEENDLAMIVPFIDDDDNQPIRNESNPNETQLLVMPTSDVPENSHDNAVILKSRPTKRSRMNRFSSEDNSDDEENILVPLRFRTPSPIFVSRNENVKIKVENDMENGVDHRKDCETTRKGKFTFLENLTGTDWTRTCVKLRTEQTLRQIQYISSPKDLLTTIPSSSSNIALSRLTGGTVAVQRASTIPELVVSPSSTPSNCEYYENQPTGIREDMGAYSQELLTTTSHLSKKNHLADLPANLMRCKVKIAKLNLDNYDTQIGTRKKSIKNSQVKSAVRHSSGVTKTTVPQKLKKGMKIVLYPGANDDCDNIYNKMQKDADADNSAIKRFCCDICGKKFTGKAKIKQHMVIHTGVKPHTCKVCERSFYFRSVLRYHLSIHTGEKKYVCDICSKAFNQSANLLRHKRIHSGERTYVCDTCPKAFRSSSGLSVHKRIHTGERPYVCDTCAKSFTSSSTLWQHKRIHSGERPYVCDTCAKSFGSSSDVSVHKRIHTGERPYVCDTCAKSFKSSSTLWQHKRIHSGERPYVCDTCAKSFTSSSTLWQHKRIHSGERPYVCDTCAKSFGSSSTLWQHKRIHSGERPYVCDTCAKSFGSSSTLWQHKRIHSGERQYFCDTCPKSFGSSSDLSRHKIIHTG